MALEISSVVLVAITAITVIVTIVAIISGRKFRIEFRKTRMEPAAIRPAVNRVEIFQLAPILRYLPYSCKQLCIGNMIEPIIDGVYGELNGGY